MYRLNTQFPSGRRGAHGRAAIALASCAAAGAALVGCGIIEANADRAETLAEALEASDGNGPITLPVRDIYPDTHQVVLVCPYGGAAANKLLGFETFTFPEDTSEGSNWVAVKEPNGRVVKVEMHRADIDLCASAPFAAEDVGTDGSLTFEKHGRTWELTGW